MKFPLIHLDNRSDWANWLRGVGIDEADVTHGPVLNRASMVIDAAINGQGIALARTTLAAWDLINGRLALAFPESTRSKT
ncbi:DNA-binding transcriptional LysR family regulator [Bradyrhizobium sp. USDA 4486]